MSPSIAVHNRQRAIKIDVAALQGFAERALELVLKTRVGKSSESQASSRDRQDACPALSHIDVILVSDRRMSELHRRFLQIDGPTDVITFQHGEIEVRPLFELTDFPVDPAESPEGWREKESEIRAAPPVRRPGTTRYMGMLKADPSTEAGTGSGLDASHSMTSNQDTGRSWAFTRALSTRSVIVVPAQTSP